MPFGHRTLSIAHRGASGMAPENTHAAIDRAIKLGVDLVEIDLRVTQDGRLVVIHDSTVDRTTNGHGAVKDITLEEIRKLKAGAWFDPPFFRERVPILEEVLDLTRKNALLLVEIKANAISGLLVEAIKKLKASEEVVVQSFHPGSIQQVRELETRIPAALLVGRIHVGHTRWRGRTLVKNALSVGANALAISYHAVTPSLVEEVHLRGLALWTWTVDEEMAMQKMIQTGADGIITNHPDRLHRLLTGEIVVPPKRPFRLRATKPKISIWRKRRLAK